MGVVVVDIIGVGRVEDIGVGRHLWLVALEGQIGNGTALKGVLSDAFQARREGQSGGIAVLKGAVGDPLHAVIDLNLRIAGVAPPRAEKQLRDALGCAVEQAVMGEIGALAAGGDVDDGQPQVALQIRQVEALETGGEVEGLYVCPVESATADGAQGIGQGEGVDVGAVGKGERAQSGDALPHDDRVEFLVVLGPGGRGGAVEVVHGARAGNGQRHGAFVHGPAQVLAAGALGQDRHQRPAPPGGLAVGDPGIRVSGLVADADFAAAVFEYVLPHGGGLRAPENQAVEGIDGVGGEGVIADLRHGGGNDDSLQIIGHIEHIGADGRQARGQRQGAQFATSGEGVGADGLHRVGNHGGLEHIAEIESISADGAKALGQGQGLDGAPLVVPGCRGFAAVVVHIAGAGDGEDAGGVVQGPAQRVAAGPFIDRTHRVAGSDRGRGVRGGRVVGIRGSVCRSGLRFRRGAAVQGVPRRKDGKHHGQGQKQSEDSFRHGNTSVSEIRVCG